MLAALFRRRYRAFVSVPREATAGFVTIGLGLAVASTAPVLIATGTPEIAPWAQVGGTATAVAALAYVAKLLADGRLVANPIAEGSAKLTELVELGLERERTLTTLLEDAKDDRNAFRELLLNTKRGSNE